MPLHAARGCAADSAPNQAEITHDSWVQCECGGIERYGSRSGILIEKHAIERIHGKSRGIHSCRFPVPRIVIFLPVGAEQTDSQSQIQRDPRSDSPVVLEVGLGDLVCL